jgi:hypothetical protein
VRMVAARWHAPGDTARFHKAGKSVVGCDTPEYCIWCSVCGVFALPPGQPQVVGAYQQDGRLWLVPFGHLTVRQAPQQVPCLIPCKGIK